MKKKLIARIIGAIVLGAGVGVAQAVDIDFGENIYLDVQNNFIAGHDGVCGATCTDEFTEFSWSGTANSIYDISGGADSSVLDPGDTVWDTSDGLFEGLQDLGTTPATNLGGFEGEGFRQLSPGWDLTFDYVLDGTLLAIDGAGVPQAALFDGGEFNIYYQDNGGIDGINDFDGLQVLSLNVDSFTAEFGTNVTVNIFGSIDYSFYGALEASEQDFVDGLFYFADGTNFYEQWLVDSNALAPISISWRVDTNITDSTPPTYDDWVEIDSTLPDYGDGRWDDATCTVESDCVLVARSTVVTPSLRFQVVPVPGTIALIGLGMLGLGAASRRNRRKS